MQAQNLILGTLLIDLYAATPPRVPTATPRTMSVLPFGILKLDFLPTIRTLVATDLPRHLATCKRHQIHCKVGCSPKRLAESISADQLLKGRARGFNNEVTKPSVRRWCSCIDNFNCDRKVLRGPFSLDCGTELLLGVVFECKYTVFVGDLVDLSMEHHGWFFSLVRILEMIDEVKHRLDDVTIKVCNVYCFLDALLRSVSIDQNVVWSDSLPTSQLAV